jgi:CPA2 family monovalent cation:H+ antiporter-2
VVAVARGVNPTLQIVVRAHSSADVDSLLSEGADQVLVDELEMGVQLFTRVLAQYQVSLDEIEDHVTTVRAGGYAALRTGIADVPLVVCEELDESCFDTRTFTVRSGVAARIGDLGGIHVVSVLRGEEIVAEPPADFALRAGDRITARGSAQAFAEAARMLRAPMRTVQLTEEQRNGCSHGAAVRPEITTAAVGCEDCLKIGDTWVHLRACMTCGGVRCCDSSKNRHATKHFQSTAHPIIRSYQPGEEWAWCYPDERML